MPVQSWANLIKEADVSENKVLPAGDYDLELKDVKTKQTKAGDKMYSCRYSVANGPYKGNTVWDNIIIFGAADKQTALRIHLRKLFTLGADGEFLGSEPSDDQIIKKIVGSKVTATLDISEFGGQDQNNVKSMKALKDAVSPAEARPAAAPAQAQTETSVPAETQEEAPETTPEPEEKPATKKRGSIPLPPPA